MHRGVGPENGIAFLIYRGREIPLEIFLAIHEIEKPESWEGVEIFVIAGYVTFPRDEHSFVKVDASIERAMDSAES